MLTRSRSMAALEAAGELARMERVSDSPRPTIAAETAPKRDPTHVNGDRPAHMENSKNKKKLYYC